MKRADRLGSGNVLIAGDKELDEGVAVLRNMSTKEQIPIKIEGIIETLKAKLTAK
jgi:histidyl-tRNA synthetase